MPRKRFTPTEESILETLRWQDGIRESTLLSIHKGGKKALMSLRNKAIIELDYAPDPDGKVARFIKLTSVGKGLAHGRRKV